MLPPRRVMLANLLDDCREGLHVHVSSDTTGGMRLAVVVFADGILHFLIHEIEIRPHNSNPWSRLLCSCLCVRVRERGERKERVRHADDGDG